MYPMSGVREALDARVAEVSCAPVFLRIRCPALVAVAQQRGATDRGPQLLQLLGREVDGGKYVHVVVELPAPRAVFVAAGGVLRQMLRLFGAQVLVLAAHP